VTLAPGRVERLWFASAGQRKVAAESCPAAVTRPSRQVVWRAWPDPQGGATMPATTGRPATSAGLGSEQVWRAIRAASFLVLAYVTPSGEPRSVGVMFEVIGRKLYVVTGPESWKARHMAADGRAAATVLVRRGGVLSLLLPIPPATISFHGTATVYPPGAAAVRPVIEKMGSLLPEERREEVAVIELVPEGEFTTYGVGVPLAKMRDTEAARARVPVNGAD
jgi:hypothetical protein